MSQWINKDDELPEVEVDVLVYQLGKGVMSVAYIEQHDYPDYWHGGHIEGHRITHWMPLPEPPTQGNKNG